MNQEKLTRALLEAAGRGDLAEAGKMLGKGASPDTVIDGKGTTLLMQAAERGKLELVRLLVENGADVNLRDKAEKQTALFPALWNGHREVAAYLLEKGADVLTPKSEGRTALMYAAHSNSVDLMRTILDRGADINAANKNGLTALMYTDEDDKKLDAMQLLLERGAAIDQQDRMGRSALMRAVSAGNLPVAEKLLEHHADTGLVDRDGWHLAELAVEADKQPKKMVALLEQYGPGKLAPYFSFRFSMVCPDCGQPLQVNGPAQQIRCASCGSVHSLDTVWSKVVDAARKTGCEASIGAPLALSFVCKNARPLCPGCHADLDADKVATGSETILACGKCGMTSSTFPAPDWLTRFRNKDRSPVQIFCGERADAMNVQLPVSSQPVAVRCVSCGASLTIEAETSRNAVCGHCGTAQYLPDGLWQTLHPVRKAVTWYIRFE